MTTYKEIHVKKEKILEKPINKTTVMTNDK